MLNRMSTNSFILCHNKFKKFIVNWPANRTLSSSPTEGVLTLKMYINVQSNVHKLYSFVICHIQYFQRTNTKNGNSKAALTDIIANIDRYIEEINGSYSKSRSKVLELNKVKSYVENEKSFHLQKIIDDVNQPD